MKLATGGDKPHFAAACSARLISRGLPVINGVPSVITAKIAGAESHRSIAEIESFAL